MDTGKSVEEMLKNNCIIINSCLLFLLIWIMLGGIVWVTKYYFFELPGHISLNNFLTLGAALGAIGAAIGAGFFAQKQIQINKYSMEVELAIRYRDHYINLIKALRAFLHEIQNNLLNNVLDLTFEAELTFAKDVQDINEDIRNMSTRLLQFQTARDEQQEEISKQKNNGYVHDAFINAEKKSHANFAVALNFLCGHGKNFNKEFAKLADPVTLKYKDDYNLSDELKKIYKKHTLALSQECFNDK